MMVKKVVLGSLFVGIVGVLIYGAILRTNAKTASDGAQGTGSGTGLGRGQANVGQDTDVAYSRGQGRGQAARVTTDEAAGAPQSVRVSEWQTVQGTVISVGAQAVDVALDDGRQLLLEGQAWALAQARAFLPRVGDVLVLQIFEEDAELKAGKIDNITNGQSVILRLEDGSPLWSASMQRGQEQTGGLGQGQISGRGQGQGAVGNGSATGGQAQGSGSAGNVTGGQGAGQGSRGNGNAAGEQASTENAAADWQTVQGSAVIADSAELVVQAGAGEQILVEGRAWTYALDQGFAVSVGDAVVVTGFHEDGEFKAVTIENLTLGQRVTVRDANGRPMWAGGARGGA